MERLRLIELTALVRAECELAAMARSNAQKVHAEAAERIAKSRLLRERLRRERNRSCPREGAGELGEDRQVGVQPNPIRSTNALPGRAPSLA